MRTQIQAFFFFFEKRRNIIHFFQEIDSVTSAPVPRGQMQSPWLGDKVESGIGLPMVHFAVVDIRWGYSQLRHGVPYTMFFFEFGLWQGLKHFRKLATVFNLFTNLSLNCAQMRMLSQKVHRKLCWLSIFAKIIIVRKCFLKIAPPPLPPPPHVSDLLHETTLKWMSTVCAARFIFVSR
jgi:hypothetical protein